MFRSPFVPARNSRHRHAALALYRALVKTGKKVPLPKTLEQVGPVHPVAHLVRKRFVKNRNYTSLRLVYAAMAAGYKFLTMFTKGQKSGSAEHKDIVRYLRQRQEESQASRAIAPPPKPIPKFGPPLLTKVSQPGQPPRYISTVRPRPLSDLAGDRQVPRVFASAEGAPFLRFNKPQPRVLSRSIGRKTKVYIKKIGRILEIEEEIAPDAASEDEWDRIVRKQMLSEGLDPPEPAEGPQDTYKYSALLSRVWLEKKVDAIHKDWNARGRALGKIAEEERALAEKEKGSPRVPRTPKDRSDEPRRHESQSKLPDNQGQKQEFTDPFMTSNWTDHIRRFGGRNLIDRQSNESNTKPAHRRK